MLRALLRATHPLPSAAVTGLAAALAAGAGRGPRRSAAVAVAVGAGQLSIGWCNDWRDAARDAAVGRTDKPVAVGAVPVTAARTAALAALAASVPLSLRLGRGAGGVHLAAVASGWAYDLGLKSTVASGLPYAVSFGLLPSVVTLPDRPAPWWAATAGALLGLGAHLANALPDLGADRATGVENLAVVLGERRSGRLAGALLLAGTAVLVAAPPAPAGASEAVALAGAVVLTAAGRTAPGGSDRPFRAAMAVAALDVGLLLRRRGALLAGSWPPGPGPRPLLSPG